MWVGVVQHAIIGGTFLRWISHVFSLTFTLKFADWSRTSPSWQGNPAAKQAVVRYQVCWLMAFITLRNHANSF